MNSGRTLPSKFQLAYSNTGSLEKTPVLQAPEGLALADFRFAFFGQWQLSILKAPDVFLSYHKKAGTRGREMGGIVLRKSGVPASNWRGCGLVPGKDAV